jgi:hypothetical protein
MLFQMLDGVCEGECKKLYRHVEELFRLYSGYLSVWLKQYGDVSVSSFLNLSSIMSCDDLQLAFRCAPFECVFSDDTKALMIFVTFKDT